MTDEVQQLRMQLADHGEIITRLERHIKDLRELREFDRAEIERLGALAAIVRQQGFELERLRAALTFYAEATTLDMSRDGGATARRALEPKL